MFKHLMLFLGQTTADFPFDPTQEEGSRFFGEFMNMVSSLGIVLLVLLGILWALRWYNQSRQDQMNDTSSIKVLERRPVSQKTVVYLVEVEGTAIAFAEGINGVTKLAEFELEKTNNS